MSRRVVVVGAGNAALCAALAASDAGADVVVLERAPQARRGGNSSFTAGAFRVAYNGVDDLRRLMPDLTDAEVERTDFGCYPATKFLSDLAEVTEYRTDPELAGLLVDNSFETLLWMRDKGLRFVPIYGRQAYKQADGRFTFWGGLTVEADGGGPGLVESLVKAAEAQGIQIHYGARALSLVHDENGVHGVVVRQGGRTHVAEADAVVLACGGFESNTEWRARYLGPNWDLCKVRGTMFNTGDGIRMALEADASPAGNWSGCHAVGWDFNAPEFGDLKVGDSFQKHSYPYGIMVNARGRRFVDEGADFRNYTYAKYGRSILEQPGQFAWQVFDSKIIPVLRGEYRIRQVTKASAPTLTALATKLEGVDAAAFLKEVQEFNAAVDDSRPFNMNVKDGRRTQGLALEKTNWANRIDEGPFEAYQVTCGITFTFGGLRIDTRGRVLNTDMAPIPGLHAAGELVGGIFYFNYPGGSGLMSGSVFGRLAGTEAGAGSI
ncbi:MAG: tricarballylate dehydrogenase [Blastococcus sp.]|jgi:tricarballylate dehydrogenase|nr:tricarballylate dehydrogenase [Blastococcus sp.]